jgi:hypothetical protein
VARIRRNVNCGKQSSTSLARAPNLQFSVDVPAMVMGTGL